ncbi:patatin-like phospholipase [Anseongella ginsenosidimutans]|uniref:Patatin-like phospholipase n=2 Tax=Anseongella ginsenosidimutans TaxID=496056 RepID=A0A4R3KTQ8_9SPHI|nr:patatin-like phospholipase family protein [Anseongella ginsenosidimutans]QEC52819.1 hypothetical protein FRZ59_11035 [Anseongella ginsenosidimutans]TCS87195.1 patatin-like phospholipase [Anseongella ginsenosidimutans]
MKEVYAEANGGNDPLLNDLLTKVCIPTFNGNDGAINVLKTKHHPEYRRDFKMPAYHAAMASASAPVYFPPHSFRFKNEFGEGANINMIDGGVFANNPSLIGIFEATDKLDIPLADISLLALGTGQGKQIIKRSWRPKNVFDWLFPNPKLVDLVLDTQAQITEQYVLFLQRALGKRSEGYLSSNSSVSCQRCPMTTCLRTMMRNVKTNFFQLWTTSLLMRTKRYGRPTPSVQAGFGASTLDTGSH